MTSPTPPTCNSCHRDDQMISTRYIPARREYHERQSGSSLYPIAFTTDVEAGVAFKCRCGNESAVSAPAGWGPEE